MSLDWTALADNRVFRCPARRAILCGYGRQLDRFLREVSGSVDDSERLLAAIAEPILEDEAARGDLDDESFQPLLDWALAMAERCAPRIARNEDATEAAGACAGSLRLMLRSAVRTAQDGEREELLGLLAYPVFDADELARVTRNLLATDLCGQPETNAKRIAFALDPRWEGPSR
jgi:hypothetical protein